MWFIMDRKKVMGEDWKKKREWFMPVGTGCVGNPEPRNTGRLNPWMRGSKDLLIIIFQYYA